jgi:broad specificity phosphatase PhoE
LTSIYFVRHGQAGTRDSYDSLSDLGRRQARLLGEYFASQGIAFAAAHSGTQARQQQTGVELAAAYRAAASIPFPQIVPSACWNEFDLDLIYQEMAPQLCAEDPEFAREFEAMRQQVRANRGVQDAEIHRRWTPSDVVMVAAWIHGRHKYSGESWAAFRERIAACDLLPEHLSPDGRAGTNGAALPDSGAERGAPERINVVVFTSATPTAVWVGRALDIHDERVMQLAGVLHNASFSIVRRRRNAQLQLFMFNAVPHLAAPEMRTHR